MCTYATQTGLRGNSARLCPGLSVRGCCGKRIKSQLQLLLYQQHLKQQQLSISSRSYKSSTSSSSSRTSVPAVSRVECTGVLWQIQHGFQSSLSFGSASTSAAAHTAIMKLPDSCLLTRPPPIIGNIWPADRQATLSARAAFPDISEIQGKRRAVQIRQGSPTTLTSYSSPLHKERGGSVKSVKLRQIPHRDIIRTSHR